MTTTAPSPATTAPAGTTGPTGTTTAPAGATAPADAFLPELRWTAAPLGSEGMSLVLVFSPEDAVVRAGGVAVPEADEPPAAAIGRLLLDFMDRLEERDPDTAAREMNPLPVEAGSARTHPVAEALAAYAAGDLAALDGLDVVQPGSAFRLDAWRALRQVPAGTTVSYGQLAAAAGRREASRAAGGACASNLAAVVVPCHRVVRADGSVGSYLYGEAAKRALLEHEGAALR